MSSVGLVWPAEDTTIYTPVPLVATDRFAQYKIEIAWSSFLKGVMVVDVSQVGGTDVLGGSSYNSPFGGPYDDITLRADNHVRVESLSWSKGRSDDLSTMDALSGSLKVRDPFGMMDRNNPASPLNAGSLVNGSIDPLRPIRVSAYFQGTWWPILFGFIRSVDWQPQGRSGSASIEFGDLMMFMETPRQDQPGAAPNPTIAYTTVDANGAAITTGGAIGLLLDWLGWKDASLRSLDTGDSIPFFEAVAQDSVLGLVQKLLQPNLGSFFITNNGTAKFEHRNTPLTYPVAATIASEMKALGSGVQLDRVRNKWTVTRQTRTGAGAYADATPQVVSDATSGNRYGERADGFSSPFILSDTQALGIANELLLMTKTPPSNLWQLSIDNRNTALMTAMLTLDLHSKVQASSLRTGLSAPFYVEQISGQIDGRKHQVNYMLSDRIGSTLASTNIFLVGTSLLDGTDTIGF